MVYEVQQVIHFRDGTSTASPLGMFSEEFGAKRLIGEREAKLSACVQARLALPPEAGPITGQFLLAELGISKVVHRIAQVEPQGSILIAGGGKLSS